MTFSSARSPASSPASSPARAGCRAPWTRARLRGFTLLELAAVLVIIGVLCGVVVVGYQQVKKDAGDTAGYQVLGAAQLDARRVASAHAMSYPETPDMVAEMAAAPGAGAGHVTVGYQEAPSTGPTEVSVLRTDDATVGFAVLSTVDGSVAGGDASGGHCLVIVDSLRTGTLWATDADAASGAASTCAPDAAACPSRLESLPGSGTDTDPYVLPEDFSCGD